jgi:hypothetical protein
MSHTPRISKLYVAVDIGCIECGEDSNVLGVFTTKKDAEIACEQAEKKQKENWSGQHSFEIFNVDGITESHNG